MPNSPEPVPAPEDTPVSYTKRLLPWVLWSVAGAIVVVVHALVLRWTGVMVP